MPDSKAPWYVGFFSEVYPGVYASLLTPERTEREAGFVLRTLDLKPNDRVLDLCCGQGRHSVALALSGVHVTGLDLSHDYLATATSAARDAGVEIETVCSDMRVIPFESTFDAVINMFTAFGYLESDEEDAKVLHQVRKALKPGGKLLIDTISREWVFKNQVPSGARSSPDGPIIVEHRDLDLHTSRNTVDLTVVSSDGARREVPGHTVRLYTLTEMVRMLAEAGLEVVEVYGGYDGRPYDLDTRRMIVVAERPRG